MVTLRILTDTYPATENITYWADVGHAFLTGLLTKEYEVWALSTRGGHVGGFLSSSSRWHPMKKYFYHNETCPRDFVNVVIGPSNLSYGWTAGVKNVAITGNWSLRVTNPNDIIQYPFSDAEREILPQYDKVIEVSDIAPETVETAFNELLLYLGGLSHETHR